MQSATLAAAGEAVLANETEQVQVI